MVIKNENECQNSKNQEALFEFAGTYGLTDGAKLSEAIQIYSHLASEGHVGAMYELGKIYWNKNFSICNTEEAISLFEKASHKGYVKAQFWLGKMYLNGDRVNKDIYRAFDLLCEAARQGDKNAQFELNYNSELRKLIQERLFY